MRLAACLALLSSASAFRGSRVGRCARLVGLVADGMPSGSVLGALAVELAIAAFCLAAFRKRLWTPAAGLPAARTSV